MPEPRICAAPNCDNPLPEGSRMSRKTCSDACRSRLAVANKTARLNEVDAAAQNAVSEVVQERVREYVNREVLTEDLLGQIKAMVGLTPQAIATVERLLDAEDAEVAMRAAQTILRYTLANNSVAPPPVEQAPSPVTIQFALPRPGDRTESGPEVVTETKMCDDCHVAKPISDFVAGSSRCQTCFDQIQRDVRAKLMPKDDSRPQ